MKTIIAVVIAAFFGSAVGYGVASQVFYRRVLSDITSQVRASASEQYYGTVLSLAILNQLEGGHTDAAKAQLAKQAVAYHRSWKDYDATFPAGQRLEPLIQVTSEQSAVLREQLQIAGEQPR